LKKLSLKLPFEFKSCIFIIIVLFLFSIYHIRLSRIIIFCFIFNFIFFDINWRIY
jgi:hypothetical protein